jgi:hypothetical protein
VEHNRNMPYITLHFDSLRSDPRFQDPRAPGGRADHQLG